MPTWTPDQIPDQSGRVALVTGASSGLGLETSAALAAKGATVLMASRNLDRLKAAAAEVRQRHPEARLEVVALDLGSLASVRAAAATVVEQHPAIHLLFNNAGVMAIPRAETEDGFEMQFGTNCLGHFALTGLVLPAMTQVAGSRVVYVSSLARRSGRIDFDDLQGKRHYNRWTAYGQTKLADLVYTVELDRRLRAAGAATVAVAAHPGYAATNLQTGSDRIQNWVLTIGNIILAQPAAEGAWPQLYAGTMPDVQGGELYGPSRLGGMHGYPKRDRIEPRALDTEVGRRLWEVSVEATGVEYALLTP